MNDEARTVTVGMGRRQRTLLAAIVGSIDEVGDPADDPAAVRLFPPISQDDSVAGDFAEMTRDDLTRLRHTDRTVLDDVLERSSGSSIEMTVAEADACARAVGSARSKCRKARDVATRPRGVLSRKPSWIRNGS